VKGLGNVYIVEQSSAAPALHDVLSFGIAADHQGMCRLQTAETLVSLRLRLNYADMLKQHQAESEDTRELDMLRIKQDGDVFELVTAIDGKQRARTEMV